MKEKLKLNYIMAFPFLLESQLLDKKVQTEIVSEIKFDYAFSLLAENQ
jgi:hypothetical protein